jgi:hypothetical protein
MKLPPHAARHEQVPDVHAGDEQVAIELFSCDGGDIGVGGSWTS